MKTPGRITITYSRGAFVVRCPDPKTFAALYGLVLSAYQLSKVFPGSRGNENQSERLCVVTAFTAYTAKITREAKQSSKL